MRLHLCKEKLGPNVMTLRNITFVKIVLSYICDVFSAMNFLH
jgi:hypothetical protein